MGGIGFFFLIREDPNCAKMAVNRGKIMKKEKKLSELWFLHIYILIYSIIPTRSHVQVVVYTDGLLQHASNPLYSSRECDSLSTAKSKSRQLLPSNQNQYTLCV